MKRQTLGSSPVRRALRTVIWAAALALVGCDTDVNVNPTAPTFPSFTPAGPGRSLEILGSLTAAQGSCLEATVLYDGQELEGARAVCREAAGCATLELSAVAHSDPGHHTISFQALRQAPEAVDYWAEGAVRVSRDGLPFEATIALEPTRARLRSGQSVTFEIHFLN